MPWLKRALVISFTAIGVMVVVIVLIILSWAGSLSKKDDSIPVLQLAGSVKVEKQPAVGCHVHVRSPGPIMNEEASSRTDGKGEFELELNSVRRNAEGYSLWARVPLSPETDLIASANLANRARQSTGAGGPVRMHCDLAIPFRQGTLDLRVVVQDRNGLPYPGEEIQLHAADRSFYLIKRLDAQGAATFTQLEPGNYHLQCLVPNRDRPAKVPRLRDGIETVFSSADVQLDSSLTAPIKLVPGGIGNGQINGEITLNGTPLPDIQIALSYRHGGYWEYHVPRHSLIQSDCKLHAATDRAGKYSFSNLPGAPAWLKWKFTTADSEMEVDKEIQTTVPGQDFNIIATASIKGKVAPDGTGAELPSVKLVARHIGVRSADGIERFYATTWTDKQGVFLFEKLPQGEYEIQQPVPLRGPKPDLVLKTEHLRLSEGEEYELTMQRSE